MTVSTPPRPESHLVRYPSPDATTLAALEALHEQALIEEARAHARRRRRRLGLAVGLGATVSAIAFVAWHQTGGGAAGAVVQEPRTSGTLPGGQRLVVARFGIGGPKLFTIDLRGNGLRPIETPSRAAWPVLSAQGDRIAFQVMVRRWPIEVMRLDGTERVRVAEGGRAPVWAPSGERLAYLVPGRGLYVVGADGRGRRRVVSSEGRSDPWPLSWQWDRSIAFLCAPRGGSAVCLVDADGRNRVVIARFPQGVAGIPSLSPDRARIAYERGNDGRIVVSRLDGSDEHVLPIVVAGRNLDCGMAWSPDGRWLALTPAERGGVYLVHPDGTGGRRIPGLSGQICGVTWRP